MTGCWYLIDTVCDRPPGICEGCERYEDWRKESEGMTECLLKKDCPFCGSHCVFFGRDDHGIYIQCLDCDAQLYHFMDKCDEQKLVDIWNRRVK